VAFPVHNPEHKQRIKDIMNIKFNDNIKARILDEKQTNQYNRKDSDTPHHSQYEIYDYLKNS
jgi:polyphosphate kinase